MRFTVDAEAVPLGSSAADKRSRSMNDKKDGVQRNRDTRKPNRLGLLYFLLACIVITLPFAVYWFFILRPLQDMVDK